MIIIEQPGTEISARLFELSEKLDVLEIRKQEIIVLHDAVG
jgi:hypothetical protein